MSRDYWNRFPTPFTFSDERRVIEGTVMGFGGSTKYPQIHIRTADGKVRTLNITQARLHERLGELEPGPGDDIRITYTGEAGTAPPGMNPTKEFTVAIRRQGAPPAARPDAGTVGSATSENEPRVGTT